MRIGQRSDSAWVGEVLGRWKDREIRTARSFTECRGLSHEALEDIYQDTLLALLHRPYVSEDHLRNALRTGIKHRALNHHRDEKTHSRILAESAAGMHAIAEGRAIGDSPETASLLKQDRLIVSEFLTELDSTEQRVFWLLAEGMRYRAIAPALGVGVNEARKTSRAVERKREHFQLLYEAGRLCGFRSATIIALQDGQATSSELRDRALAHLESCAHCRAEHKTNAGRLRRRFQGQAAALLPTPTIAAHFGRLARLDLRLRALIERLVPDGAPVGSGALRERAVGVIAGSGASAKAAVVATAILVSGAVSASHVLTPARTRHHGHTQPKPGLAQKARAAASPVSAPPVLRDREPLGGRALSIRRDRARHDDARKRATREPGGFSYLGVPASLPDRPRTAEQTHPSIGSGGEFSP